MHLLNSANPKLAKNVGANVIYMLCILRLPIVLSGFPNNCPRSSHLTNVFMNEELLKNAKVFQDFSTATPCQSPGKPCSNPNPCNIQLRNVSVSNLIPCCVKLESGSSVCQCVIKMPNSDENNQCPGKDLKLVTNQIFNMTGTSKFFGKSYPICSSLHNSVNIYKGKGEVLGDTALPFPDIGEKIGFQYFRADNFGHYYINFYVEFLLTCKTDATFRSDDLNICDNPCNSSLPFAEIWMDIPATHLSDKMNKVFMPLNGASNCEVESSSVDQCPSKLDTKCDKNKNPCCYSKNCLFPFNPKTNTCPCPPPEGNLIMANNIIMTCDLLLNTNNRVYLFQGNNPPGFFVFNWDLNFDGLTGNTVTGIFLFGRGTVIMPLSSGRESLYWIAELKLPSSAFKGCLAEIVGTLKTELPFSLDKLGI